MQGTSVLTRLTPGDPRAGQRTTVAEWLRGEQGGAFVRDGQKTVTLAEWERGAGDPKEFKSRLMPAINRYTRREHSVDDVHVRGSYVCNTRRDFYSSRFSLPGIHEAAELIVGRPKMRMHNTQAGSAEARTFDAEVVFRPEARTPDRDCHWLKTNWYTLANSAGNETIERVDGGLDPEDSIGWACAGADCSECGEPIYSCPHIPGEIYSKGFCEYEFSGLTRVVEDSFVHSGGQKGTSHFIPDGERADEMAMVATAVDRFLDGTAGEIPWDAIALNKRAFLSGMTDGMSRSVRATAESYRRAMGLGAMCAEPGDRRNTQAIVCAKEQFGSIADAARWVREHDFRADRRTEDGMGWTFAQHPEERFEKALFDSRALDPGVKARIGQIKPKEDQRSRNGSRSVSEMLATA